MYGKVSGAHKKHYDQCMGMKMMFEEVHEQRSKTNSL